MRNTRLWYAVGIVVVVFGVLPILDTGPRIAVIAAGVLLLAVPTWGILARRTGDGDSRAPLDRLGGGKGGYHGGGGGAA